MYGRKEDKYMLLYECLNWADATMSFPGCLDN